MSVGFKPENGAIVYWKDGRITTFRDTGDVFPNTPGAFKARYGRFHEEAHFPVDAETIYLGVARALYFAAQHPANPWGLRPSGDGEATPLEAHDFAATRMSSGWASSLLKRRYFDPNVGELSGSPAPSPTPPPAPPPPPSPQPQPLPPQPLPPTGRTLPPLSPASRRVEELWSIARPLAIEGLRFYRLARRKLGDARDIPAEDRAAWGNP